MAVLFFSASAAASPLSPLPVSLLIPLFLLLSLLARALLPHSHALHARLDRFLQAVAFAALALFFASRLADAYAARAITPARFFQFFLAGGVCAFLTHAACTPIDVVKTRIQTTSGRYTGMLDAFRKIVAEEGPLTLLKGLAPTAGGYFLHGAFKYSFYEVFKVLLSTDPTHALKPPLTIAAAAGFLAECIACTLLCPMEAIRIRAVADSTFPNGVFTGLSLLLKSEGLHGWYKGLPAMLMKQVPYTVGQFVSFELAVTLVKGFVRTILRIEGEEAFASISSIAGLLAGITAAIISHPGDTILSKINQEEGDGSAWSQIIRVARAAGFAGLFLGLGARVVQVSCMIGGQFLIYDSIKLWCGIVPASATVDAVKVEAVDTVTAALLAGGESAAAAIATKLR